jgi:hypothetical protein
MTMITSDDDTEQQPALSVLDERGVDRLLMRLVDYHGAPRADIPPQLVQPAARRIPIRIRAAA